MKPFNLEEAKAGKPVCTRDGRIVTFIREINSSGIDPYPVVAIINDENLLDGEEE